MASIPKRVAERIVAAIKKYQPILTAAKARDIGEADTVTIIKDMLADVFGYDKFLEVTSEYAIRCTFCDLATKVEGKLQKLIEVKAIGLDLKENHVKQVVDYAANQGVEWVLLTNGVVWRIYRVTFGKPIGHELVLEFDFLMLSAKNSTHLDWLFLICKEGWVKSVLGDFHSQKQALSRFCIGALVLSDSVADVIRRELRKLSPDIRVTNDEIRAVLSNEVIKREVVEGEKADEARKRINRSNAKRAKASNSGDGPAPLESATLAPASAEPAAAE